MESKELTAAQAIMAFFLTSVLFLLAAMVCTVESAGY